MFKKALALMLVVACFALTACSTANKYNLTLVTDGSDTKDYIYYDDERVVYVLGGLMMTEIEGESIMLESAITEGKVSIDDIINSAKEDADNDDILSTTYPDGSLEYSYESFNLVVLNNMGKRDIYFLPKELNYYSIIG